MANQQFLGPQFPAPNSQQRIQSSKIPAPRNKVELKPGHSLMDWIRLGRSGQNLTGTHGEYGEVSQEELEKHNKQSDAWTALRGKVFNITPYMEYHPGGIEELTRGAGKDATQIFDEVHKWVNADSMLEKCYIGKLKVVTPIHRRVTSLSELQPPSFPPPAPIPTPPRHDWYQTGNTVIIFIFTKDKSVSNESVIIDVTDKSLLVTLFLGEFTYHMHLELTEEIQVDYDVNISKETGKIVLTLMKQKDGIHWPSLGKQQAKHNVFVKTKNQDIQYKKCTVESVNRVTHDVKLLTVRLPEGSRMCVPIGYHVHIQQTVLDMEISRSYTVVLNSLAGEQDIEMSRGKLLYLLIKIYANGTLTPWIDTLSEGDLVKVSMYDGDFDKNKLNECNHLVLYAAGTGFTPMVRLIHHCIVEEKDSHRDVRLMLFNKREMDIIWKDQLDVLTKQSRRFTLKHVLSDADEQWLGLQGRISKELFINFTPSQEEGRNILICACGPIPFTKTVLGFAEELGYTNVHGFMG